MKQTSLAVVLLLVFVGACHNDDRESFEYGVDVQGSFDSDQVQVLVDNHEVINGKLTTSALLGVCVDGIYKGVISEGRHEIRAIVNKTTTENVYFFVSRKVYIGVSRDTQTGQVSFQFSDTPFLYD
ncbi:MAG TPA: hypothetical protein VIN08_02810 [Ohtaekwangia sp.]|uniref:hypothetical protein n=1 Tax=Ohtaekwangia sp. TaxID=2066019 RepID=UPI002F9470E8